MSAPYASELVRGNHVTVEIPDPAAGSDLFYQFPANFFYDCQSLIFRLTTGVAVANRNVRIIIQDDGGRTLFLGSPVVVQVASTIRTYCASQLSAPNTIVYPTSLQLALPPRFVYRQGYVLGALVDAIAAADQIDDAIISMLRHPTV